MTFNDWAKRCVKSIYDEFFGEPVTHPLLTRILAFTIDALLFSGLFFVINLLLHLTESYVTITVLVVFHLTLTALYFSVFNSRIGNGKTIGKRLLNLKVVDENGNLIGFWKSLVRSFPLVLIVNGYEILWVMHVMEIDFLFVHSVLYMFLIGMVYFVIAKLNRQGLHDLIACTQVVAKNETIRTTKDLTFGVISGFVLITAIVFYFTY